MNYCEFIQKVQSYQQKVETICVNDYVVFDPCTFNISTYVGFFDKIYIHSGIRIDALYFHDSTDGGPFLCGLKKGQNLDKAYEYIANYSRRIRGKFDKLPDSIGKGDDFIQKKREYFKAFFKETDIRHFIIPQDSEYGFLQYLFFLEVGDLFALFWHSKYSLKYVITSLKKMDELIEHINKKSSKKVINNFNKSSLIPVVTKEHNCYQIIWYEYRNLKGIFRCTYRINRMSPFDIKLVNDIIIAKEKVNFCY